MLKDVARRFAVRYALSSMPLRKGRVAEPATVDIHGNWKLTIRGSSCGQEISVAGAIDMNDEPGKRVFVITVFGSD